MGCRRDAMLGRRNLSSMKSASIASAKTGECAGGLSKGLFQAADCQKDISQWWVRTPVQPFQEQLPSFCMGSPWQAVRSCHMLFTESTRGLHLHIARGPSVFQGRVPPQCFSCCVIGVWFSIFSRRVLRHQNCMLAMNSFSATALSELKGSPCLTMDAISVEFIKPSSLYWL